MIVDYSNEKACKLIIGILVFLIPACAVVFSHGASYPHGILILFTMVILPFYYEKQPLFTVEKYLLTLFLLFSLWPVISWFIGGMNDYGVYKLGVYARWLLFIPVYFLLRRLQPSIYWLRNGLVVGAIAAGVYALAEIYFEFETLYPGRASGAVNPIFFGNLSLLMGAMAFSFWPVCKSRSCFSLIVMSLFLGMVASLLSGSRGGWVAIPFICVFIIWQIWPKLSVIKKLLIFTLIILITSVMFIKSPPGFSERIEQIQTDILDFVPNEYTDDSVGARLDLWHTALILSKENLIVGVGLGNFMSKTEELRGQKVPDEYVYIYKHAHNEYLSALVERGIIGLIIIIGVLFLPAYLYFRNIQSVNNELKALSYTGLSMVIGMAIFSLSDSSLSRSVYVSFYSLCTFFIVANMSANNGKLNENKNT